MRYIVAVDLGGTNVRVGLGDRRGRILSHMSERSDKSSGRTGISRQIARMIRSLVPIDKVNCIMIGSAGPLNLKDGSIVCSPNLGFGRIPLVKPLEEEFNVPVNLTNDCVAAVVAEKQLGQGRKCSNLVFITISSGIGAGAIVDNHLLIGKDGNAHEVGHMTIDQSGGLECGCGRTGHWEAYCGGSNIPNLIKLQMKLRTSREMKRSRLHQASRNNQCAVSTEDLFEFAKRGDRLALDIVEEMGRLNAMGFANIVNVYDPDLITVGGSVALLNTGLVLRPIRRLMAQHSVNRTPKIRATKLGEDIVLRGALLLSKCATS